MRRIRFGYVYLERQTHSTEKILEWIRLFRNVVRIKIDINGFLYSESLKIVLGGKRSFERERERAIKIYGISRNKYNKKCSKFIWRKHVYTYFICKILKAYQYDPEDSHRRVQDFRKRKLLFAPQLITSHFKETRTETGPMWYLKFWAKHTHLCFSTRKLARYKTHLKSFFKYHAPTIP